MEILEVLTTLYQKFPAALLRKIKEHIYELVNTNDPTEKIAVVNFDTDTDLEKVDVVIGIGVSGKTEKHYETFSRFDIAEDILHDNKCFDTSVLVTKTLPKLIKATSWIPVCKYINQIKPEIVIDTKIQVAATRDFSKWKLGNPYNYKLKVIQENYNSIEEVVEINDPSKSVKIILLLDNDKINIDALKQFLVDNFALTQDVQQSSYYMKLLCLYDRLKYA